MIRFECPSCKAALKADEKWAAKRVNCPKCKLRLLVPPPQRKPAFSKIVPAKARPAEVQRRQANLSSSPKKPVSSSSKPTPAIRKVQQSVRHGETKPVASPLQGQKSDSTPK